MPSNKYSAGVAFTLRGQYLTSGHSYYSTKFEATKDVFPEAQNEILKENTSIHTNKDFFQFTDYFYIPKEHRRVIFSALLIFADHFLWEKEISLYLTF